ncbi:hypothetical protein BDV26DRAFT_270021 [Aspergillus bertholletiae]|uniref:Uncharacterized protein n=1 Tax=Aspergillus bertholletiae TaxID=1226010 RepID=A0A5N7AX45_9EURO|nr:hypothetical protein BDV26DRAFT_270021 [Aspergillus bertholletiae]
MFDVRGIIFFALMRLCHFLVTFSFILTFSPPLSVIYCNQLSERPPIDLHETNSTDGVNPERRHVRFHRGHLSVVVTDTRVLTVIEVSKS